MLDLQEYISSGIVEKYVLGLTDKRETLEFEQLLPNYPELKTAMLLFEVDLENTLVENGTPPPARVWNYIQTKTISPEYKRSKSTYSRSNGNGKGNDETIISVVSNDQIRVHKYFRYAFIALVILSKVFLYAAISYYLMYKDEMKQRVRLEQQLQQVSPSLRK